MDQPFSLRPLPEYEPGTAARPHCRSRDAVQLALPLRSTAAAAPVDDGASTLDEVSRRRVEHLLHALIEVRTGHRTTHSVRDCVNAATLWQLQSRLPVELGSRFLITSMWSQVTGRRIEVSATVLVRPSERVVALAAALVKRRGELRVTSFDLLVPRSWQQERDAASAAALA